MTRTDNIKRNLIFNTLRFATQLVLQFVVRTALIYLMGVEYIGLNGLFTNIFSFLNLAELGIGSAIVFSMYKPIADGDDEKVKALQNLYKKFYLIISIVIFSVGLILTPFLSLFIKNGGSVVNIYILFILYLINTLAGYFSAHKRSLLFAYQRNDIENKIKSICLALMSIIQILVLILFKNYYLFFIVNIIFTIIENALIHISANKILPQINGKAEQLDKQTKTEISKNVAALSFHRIGAAVVMSTDNILISAFFGVVLLGTYSNYYLIINAILSIFTLINNAIMGSAGNLVASSDKEYVYSKFKMINFLFSFLSAFSTICLFVLFQPFISLWTKYNPVYLLSISTVFIICISFYLMRMRTAVLLFRDATGLFWQDRWKPIVEAVVNLVVSILLAKWIGINGIFLGTVISTLAAPLWVEPKILYKHYFKKNAWPYFCRYLIDVIIMLAVGTICYMVCSFIPDGGVWLLIAKFATCIPLCVILLIITYLPTKEFKDVIYLCKSFIKKLFHKNKKL